METDRGRILGSEPYYENPVRLTSYLDCNLGGVALSVVDELDAASAPADDMLVSQLLQTRKLDSYDED